ncbi:MAG: NAD(P)-dependent alcohol dehydrogenase [Acidimicrobiia bacterium]
MMKAIAQDRHGGRDVLMLREVPRPQVGDDEVLVRVHAASVGAWDAHAMSGDPRAMAMLGLLKPKRGIAGQDLAGRVEEAGKNVTRHSAGDAVYGHGEGAFAEYVCMAEDETGRVPTNLSFEEAAAVPIAGITALIGLRDAGQIKDGQRVLIVGASGGVGTFAVQIAKAYGAVVTAVCSTEKVDMVRSIGADHVIDYTEEDFTKAGRTFDLVLELADSRSLADYKRVLTPKGTLVMSSGVGGRWLGPMGRMAKAMVLSPFVSQTVRILTVKTKATDLDVLTGLIESGRVMPVIDRTYPMTDAPLAVEYVEAGHTCGKTVVTMPRSDAQTESN